MVNVQKDNISPAKFLAWAGLSCDYWRPFASLRVTLSDLRRLLRHFIWLLETLRFVQGDTLSAFWWFGCTTSCTGDPSLRSG